MRKHDVRKWLHAVLDLLPVILIPVFMIYSHRHDVAQDFEVAAQEPVYYESNEVNNANDLIKGNIYLFEGNNITFNNAIYIYISDYVLSGTYSTSTGSAYLQTPYLTCETHTINIRNTIDGVTSIYQYSNNAKFYFVYNGSATINIDDFVNYVSETDYKLVKEYTDVTTTIPKDVMTSFMDRFNNTINQYFNMGNVFNLNGVYQWFNTNIFSGHAPTIIYSIWNIALYELVMDLLFLLYGLFMWFIDIVENIMNKPFKSIK